MGCAHVECDAHALARLHVCGDTPHINAVSVGHMRRELLVPLALGSVVQRVSAVAPDVRYQPMAATHLVQPAYHRGHQLVVHC